MKIIATPIKSRRCNSRHFFEEICPKLKAMQKSRHTPVNRIRDMGASPMTARWVTLVKIPTMKAMPAKMKKIQSRIEQPFMTTSGIETGYGGLRTSWEQGGGNLTSALPLMS
jgi:hypothetical protein